MVGSEAVCNVKQGWQRLPNMTDARTVTELIADAFNKARSEHENIVGRWISLSFRLGQFVPDSLMFSNIQRLGDLDVLLRSMEAETSQRLGEGQFVTHQSMFSSEWIGGCYEALRSVRQRNTQRAESRQDGHAVLSSSEFEDLFRDLEVLRIGLEKHELPVDRKIKVPLAMARTPPIDPQRDHYTYDPKDPNRAHIMPDGLSSRGSMMWLAADPVRSTAKWLERRELSDRILGLLLTL
jgi:hypothetical protein